MNLENLLKYGKLGFSGIIAVWLIYFLTNSVIIALPLLQEGIQKVQADIAGIKKNQGDNRSNAASEHEELSRRMETGNQLLRGICYGVNRDLSRSEQNELCNH